jgi:N-acetyl-gamma-glutamyl-phosphate reductase
MDVVFLALPHKVSATLAEELAGVSARIIDLSGDFRLREASEYRTFYGDEHPHPCAPRRSLGLRPAGADRRRHPQGDAGRVARLLRDHHRSRSLAAGGRRPAARGGAHGRDHRLVGLGRLCVDRHAPPAARQQPQDYKVLNHQHTPEIEQTLRLACTRAGQEPAFSLAFVPVSAPLVRGILATTFVPLGSDHDAKSVAKLFEDYYREATFVRVLGSKVGAEVVAVKGSMYVDLSWNLGAAADGLRQLVVTTALDNLVKGGAGQAVQSMNLMFGLPEGQGIDAPAMWP